MRGNAIALLFLVSLLTAAPASAYVDPGTGGMLVQLVSGGIAGLLVLGRLFWSRIIGGFRKDDSAGTPSGRSRPGHQA